MEYTGFTLVILTVDYGTFKVSKQKFDDASECFNAAEEWLNFCSFEASQAGDMVPYTLSFELIGHTEAGDFVLLNSFPTF